MINTSVLQTLDDIAAIFRQLNPGLRLGIAQSPADFEAAYRLRYETVIEKGWAKPDEYPYGLERDRYDDHAIQLVAWDGEKLAGTGRVVLPSPDYPLPAETLFELTIEPRGQVVELGRAAIDSSYRGISQQIFLSLLGQSWLATRDQGLYETCGVMILPMVRLYHFIGFHLIPLAPPRLAWGEERAPYQLDLLHTAETLQNQGGLFWKKLARLTVNQ
jgi:hypothetical protein